MTSNSSNSDSERMNDRNSKVENAGNRRIRSPTSRLNAAIMPGKYSMSGITGESSLPSKHRPSSCKRIPQ